MESFKFVWYFDGRNFPCKLHHKRICTIILQSRVIRRTEAILIRFVWNSWKGEFAQKNKRVLSNRVPFRAFVWELCMYMEKHNTTCPPKDGPSTLCEQSLRVYPYKHKTSYDIERICRMKDQQRIPYTEQMWIHSIFRRSAMAMVGVSQISTTSCVDCRTLPFKSF